MSNGPWNWRAQPSAIGDGLQRYSNARNGSTKGVATRRAENRDTSTFRGMSKKAEKRIREVNAQGCYFMDEGDKARAAAEARRSNG